MYYKILKFVFKVKDALYYRIWYKYFLLPYCKESFAKCGDAVTIGKHCDFIHGNIEIGNDVHIGDYCSFLASIAKIHIGNHVIFGPHVTIRGGDHRTDLIGRYIKSVRDDEKLPENDKDIYIDDDVWIGCNVTILKGVHIGRGSVIGAGSIVVKDIPPYTIHVGCPGVKDFHRFTDDQIEEHENILYGKEEK